MEHKRLDTWCERGILGLVLAIMVFGPLATGAVRAIDFLVIQGLTLGVVALWAVRLWCSPRPAMLWPPICWAVLAFLGYAIGRYLTADIEYVAREELVRVLVYGALFFAILSNLHRQESTQIVCFTVIGLATLISFYALYQFLTHSDRVWNFISPYQHRGSGTYISPNHLAGFLEMLLPLGLAYALTSRLKPVGKILLGYAALVFLAAIGVTISRAGWFASGLTVLVFFGVLMFRRGYRVLSVVLLGALILIGVSFFSRTFYMQKRFEHLISTSATQDVRLMMWGAAYRMWQDHLCWGVGPAHFDHRFPAYRPEEVQLRPERVHNDFLNTLADWGLAGAVLVASAWGLLGLGVLKTWKHLRTGTSDLGGRQSNRFAFVLGASLGLLAIFLHSAFDFNMHVPANAILAVALMAMLSGYTRFATDRYWLRVPIWGKVLATLALAAALTYLGAQGWQRARETFWLARAAGAPSFSQEEVVALEKAFAADPRNFMTAFNLGEAFRTQSFQGGDDYRELAEKAMAWYERSLQLNPHHAHSHMRYGMCLHWIGRHAEADPHFQRAAELDPNGYFTVAHMGWHYVQLEKYAAAKPWFERSRRLYWQNNQIADSYLEIVKRKMIEGAAPQ